MCVPSRDIDLGAIERNCARLPKPLCAVVKANAYGHGTVPVAEAALAGGAEWLAVATADEAAELRAGGIGAPGARDGRAHAATSCASRSRPSADVVAWTEEVAEAAPRVHVKLDTGMGRLGTKDRELALRLAARPNTVGLMTHFATADEPGDEFFPRAARRASASSWTTVGRDDALGSRGQQRRRAARPGQPLRHGALRRRRSTAWTRSARTPPSTGSSRPCRCARGWRAVRRFEAGRLAPATAGAGRAPEPTWVATVPIGYGDGWRRALTNNCGRADPRPPALRWWAR